MKTTWQRFSKSGRIIDNLDKDTVLEAIKWRKGLHFKSCEYIFAQWPIENDFFKKEIADKLKKSGYEVDILKDESYVDNFRKNPAVIFGLKIYW